MLESILKAPRSDYLTHLGKEMFRFKTELGFPPDMFIQQCRENKLTKSQAEEIAVVFEFQSENTRHIEKAGISERRLERLREYNRRVLSRFMSTGEIEI